jgi:rhodanese-related sulfurtransferase
LIIAFVAVVGFDSPAVAAENGVNELKGVFIGKSYKAKLISLLVGEKTLLVAYDGETEGLDEVGKGDNVLLRYRGEGAGEMAIEVIPELVKIPAGVTEIDVEELLSLVDDTSKAGKYLLVDCRPADFYAEAHLPSAVSIPWTETKEVKLAALPADKEQLLIFYCLGATCLLGPNSATMAVEAGYKNVRVLLADLSEWQEIGGKLYSGDDYIANGNVVLVDLRSPQEAEVGHIPGAVNIPAEDIPEAEYDFPVKKSAPVIVYGNGSDPVEAVTTIKGWGFRHVSLVEGGYDGWSKRGNPVKSGEISSLIRWQRRLGEGEISIGDFKKVAEGKSDVAVIVDVRTEKESSKGSFDNAILIPLNELEARLAEIPEDKDIYLHCATGSRAKMAWSFLKQHRKKVRFLHARVVSRKGTVKIRP